MYSYLRQVSWLLRQPLASERTWSEGG